MSDIDDSILGYQKLIKHHQKYIDEYQKRIAKLRRQEREQGMTSEKRGDDK